MGKNKRMLVIRLKDIQAKASDAGDFLQLAFLDAQGDGAVVEVPAAAGIEALISALDKIRADLISHALSGRH